MYKLTENWLELVQLVIQGSFMQMSLELKVGVALMYWKFKNKSRL